MKKIILILAFNIIFFAVNAQSYDCYKVGDVIYSVLDTMTFQKLHGNKWKLLASQDVSNTDLVKKHNYYTYKGYDDNGQVYYRRNIPDARSVFLMPSNNLAVFLNDEFQSHTHFIPAATDDNYNIYSQNLSKNVITNQVNSNSTLRTEVNNDGAIETRPRNIALYIYIKVDE